MNTTWKVFLLAGALLIGCNKTTSDAQTQQAVRVNDEWISSAEIEQTAEMLRQGLAQYSPGDAMNGVTDNLRKAAARQLIANEVMLEEARDRGIDIDAPKFDSLYRQFRAGVGDEAAFTRMLTAQGITEEQFEQQMKESIALDSLMKLLLANSDTVTEAQSREFYESHPEVFSSPQSIRSSQIVFLYGNDTTAEQKAALKAKAEKVHANLKEGADFAETARKQSMGPAARSGGDVGWARAGDMRPEVYKALKKLAEGEISSVIPTDFGFFILRKTGVKEGEAKEFDQVKDKIAENLEVRNRSERIGDVVDSLIGLADVEYADTLFAPASMAAQE